MGLVFSPGALDYKLGRHVRWAKKITGSLSANCEQNFAKTNPYLNYYSAIDIDSTTAAQSTGIINDQPTGIMWYSFWEQTLAI